MTVKTVRLNGTDWSDEDILYAADQNDTITRAANEPYYKLNSYNTNINTGLVKFSSVIWQTEGARTINAGSSWTTGGYQNASCTRASGAKGFSVIYNTGASEYTTDSGANWNNSSTDPANVTEIYGGDLVGSAGVLCGKNSSGGTNPHIWVTTDGGDNWADVTTGPKAAARSVLGICLHSAGLVGYCVLDNGDIWRTADAGVNWAVSSTPGGSGQNRLYAIDTDTILMVQTDGSVYTYVHSTTTKTTLLVMEGGLSVVSNIVKATNGNYYWILYEEDATPYPTMFTLFKYDGTNVYGKPLQPPGAANLVGGNLWRNSANAMKDQLIEVSDTLYYSTEDIVWEIDVNEE